MVFKEGTLEEVVGFAGTARQGDDFRVKTGRYRVVLSREEEGCVINSAEPGVQIGVYPEDHLWLAFRRDEDGKRCLEVYPTGSSSITGVIAEQETGTYAPVRWERFLREGEEFPRLHPDRICAAGDTGVYQIPMKVFGADALLQIYDQGWKEPKG